MSMIRIITVVGLLALTSTVGAQTFETATEAVKNMRVGWNLGNTLDTNSGDTLNMWIERWTGRAPSDYETAWGQKVTKPALFKMMKEAGFNAIRVPVTWYPHMEAKFAFTGNSTAWYPSKDDFGTKIDERWMKRVHEVVDYVISQDMYCILNVHHDTGEANTAWLIADEAAYARQHERFEAIWTQIAEEFKDYDEHLLFEGYNEMLDSKRSWCFASFAASNNYNATIARSAYNAINSFAQSFVDAVRATGGNNLQRNLIVSTYGACSGFGNWNSHLQDPLIQMKLPKDTVQNHLLFEIHAYPEVKNLSSAKSELRTAITNIKKNLVAKGAPVIIGEWGSLNLDEDYKNLRDNVLAYSRYFMEQTKANGIGTFYWMGLSDGAHRTVPEFNQTDLLEAIMMGYYGENGYVSALTPIVKDAQEPAAVYGLNGIRLPAGSLNHSFSRSGKGIQITNGRKYFSR